MPSPQLGHAQDSTAIRINLVAIIAGFHTCPTVPSPQTGKAQAFVQPSVFTWLPSSQASTLPELFHLRNWQSTGIRAAVCVHLVAIIAGFTGLVD